MTQQKNAGMRLRQVMNPRKKDASWLMQMIVAMLASTVLVLTATELTGNTWIVMLVVSVWLCVVYGILLKTKHESWFYLGTLILMLLLTLVFRKQVLEGFRIFWNTASDAMVSGTGRVLPEWELQLSKEQSGFCVSLFSGVCGCMVSLICCGLTSAIPAVLAVLLPAMMLFGMVTFGAEGSSLWLLPVLAVSVLILMYSGWRRKGSLAPVMMSWAVTGTIACLLIALALLPGFQNWTAQIRENVHESIHEKKYETKYTTLPEGDFSDYQKKEQKAKQALAVTMENPQQLYLRGFTGAVFTGDTWEALDTEALVKNKDLLYWLNLNAFDQNAQFDAAATYAGLRQSTVTVQNIGACSFYQYVPFSIGKGAWAEAENLNTDGVYGEGERSYVYSVTAGTSGEIMEVLTYLQTSEDPAVLQYRKAESGYRQFINHYYLQVPEDVKALLKEEWDEIASRYLEKEEDVRKAAKAEYDTAKQHFVGVSSDDAKMLASDLNKAIQNYESALAGTKYSVSFTDGSKAYSTSNYPGVTVVAENPYGKMWTDEGDGALELPVGEYTFCVEQDGLRVEGSVTVTGNQAVTVELPDNLWLKLDAFRLSGTYGEDNNEEKRFVDGELEVGQWNGRTAKVAVPDLFTGAVYTYAEYDIPS